MNRDFIGALLQLNAEKNIPREQLVATVADAIQSAYRRVAPGQRERLRRASTPRPARCASIARHDRRRRGRGPDDRVHRRRGQEAQARRQGRRPRRDRGAGRQALSAASTPRSPSSSSASACARSSASRSSASTRSASREIITGTVSRVEPRGVILDVGRAEAILPTTDQIATEHYRIGQHVKAYVLEVRRTTKGPLIYVSRTHKNFLRRLFELEVPEIHAGTVEIKAIAREAGSRSKVAVSSRQEGLDPVGATVGQRGGRVQAVVAELGGEKIDVIPWHEDPAVVRRQRAQPGAGRRRRHRRGEPHRQRDRARADALAGHRPRGPERPPGGQADRLAHRHPQRPGAAARRLPTAARAGAEATLGRAEAAEPPPRQAETPVAEAPKRAPAEADGRTAGSRATRRRRRAEVEARRSRGRSRRRRRPAEAAEASRQAAAARRRPRPRRRAAHRRRPRRAPKPSQPPRDSRRDAPKSAEVAS